MSTKIYDAYRVREGVAIWPMLWEIKRRGQTEARARLARVYDDILADRGRLLSDWYAKTSAELHAWVSPGNGTVAGHDYMRAIADGWQPSEPKPECSIAVTQAEVRAFVSADPDEPLDVADVDWWTLQQYSAQLTRTDRGPWNLDVSVSVRELDGRLYLKAHCDRASIVGGCLAFLDAMPELEDCEYRGGIDHPSDVSEAEWYERATAWGRMRARWQDFVMLEIVSWDTFAQVSPLAEMVTHG